MQMKKFIVVITLLLALVLFSVTAIEPVPFFGEVVTVGSVSTFESTVGADSLILSPAMVTEMTNDRFLLAESSVLTGQMIDRSLIIGALLSVIVALYVLINYLIGRIFAYGSNITYRNKLITLKGCVMPEGRVA